MIFFACSSLRKPLLTSLPNVSNYEKTRIEFLLRTDYTYDLNKYIPVTTRAFCSMGKEEVNRIIAGVTNFQYFSLRGKQINTVVVSFSLLKAVRLINLEESNLIYPLLEIVLLKDIRHYLLNRYAFKYISNLLSMIINICNLHHLSGVASFPTLSLLLKL